jgi:hypothetical protein
MRSSKGKLKMKTIFCTLGNGVLPVLCHPATCILSYRSGRFFQRSGSLLPVELKTDIKITHCHVCFGPTADMGYGAGLEALKPYLLLLKKYRPASFKRSNS